MGYKQYYGAPTQGLNDKHSPLMLDRAEAAQLDNFVVNDRGILDKVKGYQKDGSPFPDDADSFIRMLVNYKRGSTVDLLVMAAMDEGNTNATYKVDLKKTSGDGTYSYLGHTAGTSASFINGSTAVTGTGTSWSSHLKAGDKIKATSHSDSAYGEIQTVNSDTSITLTANYSGETAAGVAYTARIILDKTSVPRAIVFNNKLVITNGAEKPMTFDNTTLNAITDADAPRGRFIEAHKSRVFIACTSGGQSTIYWSAVNNEASWDAASLEPVFPEDNGTIIGIKSFGDSLIVLKNNGNIYQVVGDFDTSAVGEVQFIRKIDTVDNIGSISERSIVVHTDGLYFLSDTGLWKLDPRMFLQKVSYKVDDILGQANFALGPSQNKSFAQDTKSQWDTGTHSGTKASTDGTLSPYFDVTTITDFDQTATSAASVHMDSSYNVYVAYVNNNGYLAYAKWLASDNSITTSVVYSTATVTSCAISVAGNGTIGIAFTTAGGLFYTENTGSSWSSATSLDTGATTGGVGIAFNSSNDPRVTGATPGGAGVLHYKRRILGVWDSITIGTGDLYQCTSLVLNSSDNPRVATMSYFGNRGVQLYQSNNDGSTWSNLDALTTAAAVHSSDYVQMSLDGSGNPVSEYFFYNESAGIKKRVHATATTSVTDANGLRLYGAILNASGEMNALELVSTSTEKYVFENSLTVTNQNTNTGAISNRLGDKGMYRSGNVYASICPGANANELILRRLTFRGVYTSQENTDATLSAWGTYDIADQVSAGNTITHEVALNTVSPATSYNSILNGAVISSNASNIFVKNRITFLLANFAQSSLGSVVLNYVGAGVDAKQATAISFETELYLAIAKTSDTANAHLILYDTQGAYFHWTHPVSAMCAYKGKIYAGKSTNGDLLVLRQTYGFNASAYTATYISKEDFLDSIELEKDIKKIYVLFEVKSAGSFTFSWRTDNFVSVDGSSWNSTTVDQTSKGIAEILVGKKARTIQCRIQNSTVDNECSIIGYVIALGEGGRNGYLNER